MSTADTQKLLQFLKSRRSTHTPDITAPGPTKEELTNILTIGLRVPDHGKIEPWRVVVIEGEAKTQLAKKLAASFEIEKHTLTPKQQDKLTNIITKTIVEAPLIIYVISSIDSQSIIPVNEQLLSAGAVCMNTLWAASAYGYAANWISGWLAYSEPAKNIIGVKANEQVAGVIFIGTTAEPCEDRKRPDLSTKVNFWSDQE